MLDNINNAINKFYKGKDPTLFKEICTKQIPLFKELRKFMNKQGFKFEEALKNQSSSSIQWIIHFDDYKNGELEITYKTILKISKLIPLFYVQHEFSIKNVDENGLVPYLAGIDNSTCLKQQVALEEKIKAILKKKGYIRLEYPDMNEAVSGFKIPENLIEKFGPNVTVEHLLFMDLFNICGRN